MRNLPRPLIEKNSTWVFLLILTSQTSLANECDSYKERIAYYQHLRTMGGNAEEMNRWTAIGHELDDQLYHCTRDLDINPTIQTVTGERNTTETPTPKRGHTPSRNNVSNDSRQQSLIKTCNYWIDTSNQNLTQDNISFRDTACRAVDNYKSDFENPGPSTQVQAVRKLKDCIKPNNLIDSDVNECVRGNLEPTWKK